MGKILIVSGFSGVGKGTVIHELLKMNPEIQLSISETDREKRNDNDKYVFVTPEQFQENLKFGRYMEFNHYGNHYYATPRNPVLECMNQGTDGRMILEIDVHGMRMICQDIDLKRLHTDIITVFVVVDAESLVKRLHGRGDSDETTRKRLKIAIDEVRNIREYEYVLINQNPEDTAARLLNIMQGESDTSDSFDGDRFQSDISKLLQTFQ